MSEKQLRQESLQPLHEQANALVQEMGERPEQRLDWLMQQNGESFGQVLIAANAAARGLEITSHDFDGEGIQAGTLGGSIPPDQEDKVALLGTLVTSAQEHALRRRSEGADPQTIVTELAAGMPTVLNKLHLFGDANGRTTRLLRMVLRDGDQVTSEKIDALVNKHSHEKYDTTPARPVERAVRDAMLDRNGTAFIRLHDDLVLDSEYIEDQLGSMVAIFPELDRKVIKACEDSFNFDETLRLMAKSRGSDVASMTALLHVVETPEGLQEFTDAYRFVRKQRAEILIEGLLGAEKMPIPNLTERETTTWVNRMREKGGLPPIDASLLSDAAAFQMAYEETFSPPRTVAQAA